MSGWLHFGTCGAGADRMMDGGIMHPCCVFNSCLFPSFSTPLWCSVVFSPSDSSPQLPSWTRGWPRSPFTSSCSCLATDIVSWSTLGWAANRPEPPAGGSCHRRLPLQQLTRWVMRPLRCCQSPSPPSLPLAPLVSPVLPGGQARQRRRRDPARLDSTRWAQQLLLSVYRSLLWLPA